MAEVSRRFREGLRQELPRWREEGLVSPDAAAALSARYRLAEAEPGGPGLLPVYVLGALLVGAGVVSLVAWNWEAMGRVAKLLLIGGAMVGCHAGGFILWRGGRAPRLGHAIVLLGTLVFAANVGLVAQIFNVSGVWWAGFGAIALGALAAGVLYESLPHLLLAAAVALLVFGPGFAVDHPSQGVAAAYGLAALFLAFAWRTRSRALAVIAALGLAAMLGGALGGLRQELLLLPAAVAVAALLASAPLAAAPLAARSDTGARLAGALRVVGRVGFYAGAYLLSFAAMAREVRFHGGVPQPLLFTAGPAFLLAAAALLVGLRRPEVDPLARGEAMLLTATVLAFVAGLSLERGQGAVLVANLALGFLATGRIVRGLSFLQRGPFWEGIGVAGVLVLSRFLEIDTGLLAKGAGFIACGLGVLAAGFAFERRRARAAEVPHVA